MAENRTSEKKEDCQQAPVFKERPRSPGEQYASWAEERSGFHTGEPITNGRRGKGE